MQVPHRFGPDSAVFDDDNPISHAGLVRVLPLAEQTGLHQLLAEKVSITSTAVASAGANLAPKLATIVAGICAGADSIDDIEVLRAGGHKGLFTSVYAPATLVQALREFTFGHARQLDSVLTGHLRALTTQTDVLPGAATRTFIDIDALLRPVYGHAKQGACYGHSKIAGIRLRAGKAGSGKGAGRMVAQAITTARQVGATGTVIVRGDSAYGSQAVVRTCVRAGIQFSVVMTKEQQDRRRHRSHRRGCVDPGEVSRCGARPCSPTSSTGRSPTCRQGSSAPTAPGSSARPPPQPSPRRRNPRRRLRPSSRRDPATADHRNTRTPGPTRPHTKPASTDRLALVRTIPETVAERNRRHLNPTPPNKTTTKDP